MKPNQSFDTYRKLLCLSLLDFFREHLILSEFTESSYGTAVSPLDAYILLDLSTNPHLKISELATILAVNKSTISRSVSQLIATKYLLKKDGYYLTKLGQNFLDLQEDFNRRQIAELSADLSKAETSRFAKYFWKLAEDQQAPVLPLTNKTISEQIKIAVRRVTRLYQIVGSNAYDSGWSSLDWLLLAEIHYNKLSTTELSTKLKILLNTLSQRLKIYQQKGLVVFQAHEGDQRVKLMSLTNQGLVALRQLEDAATKIFAAGFSTWSLDEIEDYLLLLRRYVKSRGAFRGLRVNQTCYVTRADSQDLPNLRWHLINVLSKRDRSSYSLTENFFQETSLNFKLIDQSKLVGAIEFVRESSAEVRLVNFVSELKLTDQEAKLVQQQTIKMLVGANYRVLY